MLAHEPLKAMSLPISAGNVSPVFLADGYANCKMVMRLAEPLCDGVTLRPEVSGGVLLRCVADLTICDIKNSRAQAFRGG